MNDADRNLLQRAIDALSGRNQDPVREGLTALVEQHGREAVAKSAADLQLAAPAANVDELEMSDEQLAQLLANGDNASENDEADPVAKALKPLVDRLDKLEGKTGDSQGEGEPLPEDELALVKAGVPVEMIEDARPILRSEDKTARTAAFAMLAKSARPANATLLAKEQGTAAIPSGEEIPAHAQAWARGDDLNPRSGIDQLAKQLSEALANGGRGR